MSERAETNTIQMYPAAALTEVFYPLASSRYRRSAPLKSSLTPVAGSLYLLCKRVLDVMASFALIIGLSPFLLFVGFLIRLDSPGPAVYAQMRRGRNQGLFRIFKFRTMTVDAHQRRENLRNQNEVDGILFKMRQDPRITRIGRVLRKYSIDELPQLLNVLKGDMSLVGPRPLPVEDFERGPINHPYFDQWVSDRHHMPPGMTGLWQVSGRNNLPFRELMRLDLQYVNSPSLFLDLVILFQTVRVVLHKEGAY